MNANAVLRILVVEDDALFRAVLEQRLGLEGYDLRVAADGREGMKVIVAEAPDLVLSDWMMPHVDGLELCQSVKTGLKEEAPYFIILTAKGQVSDRLLAHETGADDYLMKPCDMSEVVARVRIGERIIQAGRAVKQARLELATVRQQLEDREHQLLQLAELMPTCSRCGRVRSMAGVWEEWAVCVERARTRANHDAACPECSHGRTLAA